MMRSRGYRVGESNRTNCPETRAFVKATYLGATSVWAREGDRPYICYLPPKLVKKGADIAEELARKLQGHRVSLGQVGDRKAIMIARGT